MTAPAFLAELLAPFVGPATATPATSATSEQRRGSQRASAPATRLRHPARSPVAVADVAASRNAPSTPESEQPCGLSQKSQLSQGMTAQCTPERPNPGGFGWDDAAIARFLVRRDRLLRWGWPEPEAEALADRLTRRDAAASRGDTDDRVSCVDCANHRPGRCAEHRRAGLSSPEVGRDFAGLLQRCPGFQPEE